MYFVTICTANRECYFGDSVNSQIRLSELGKIAESEWIKTVELRPDMNLELGEFVIMPNHVHGIIVIGKNSYNQTNCRDAMHRASTKTQTTKNSFGAQSKNLASIIRGYKSAVTTYARKNNTSFGWQSRFHDHIIFSIDDYQRISNYILNNPAN